MRFHWDIYYHATYNSWKQENMFLTKMPNDILKIDKLIFILMMEYYAAIKLNDSLGKFCYNMGDDHDKM